MESMGPLAGVGSLAVFTELERDNIALVSSLKYDARERIERMAEELKVRRVYSPTLALLLAHV